MDVAEPASHSTASLMGMEAANRWETEAIRESRDRRSARPTVSQGRKAASPVGDWRTLREVSDETGIPIGTLRKWCRRESVDSYLESDGEQTLRMLEMGSVRANAKAMGRELSRSYQPPATSRQPEEGRQEEESQRPTANSQQPEAPVPGTQYSVPSTAGEASPTMIVPIDAWNKMLNQLGNLHEAGQQLAEARERAGKAETEAKFLRERLAEMRERSQQLTADSQQPEAGKTVTGDTRQAEESYQPPATSHQQDRSQRTTDDGRQAEEGRQLTANSQQAEESYQPPAASQRQEPEPLSMADVRSSSSPSGGGAAAGGGGGQGVPIEDTTGSDPVPPAEGRGDAEERSDDAGGSGSYPPPATSDQPETTSFFRYVVRGWRGRKR